MNIEIKNSRGVLWDDLKNTLKLKKAKPSALKVAADSCCGNKPYRNDGLYKVNFLSRANTHHLLNTTKLMA